MGGCCSGNSSDDRVSIESSEYYEQIKLLQYGEPLKYDQEFKGPRERRSCTDVFCLIIFFIFLVAWGFVGLYAVRNGDLNKLLVPTDSLNRKCGIDGPVRDKKYLLFFNLEKCIDPLVPITGCPTPQVCVESCPTETFVWDLMKDKLSIEQLKEKLICQTELDKRRILTKSDAALAIEQNRCTRWYVQSKPLLNRCLWNFASDRCEYIPSILRSMRKRDTSHQIGMNSSSFVSFPPNTERRTSMGFTNQQLKEADEPVLDCSVRQKLGESIIKDKMMKTNSYLSRLVGNIVAHFYNGEDPQQVGERIVEDIMTTRAVILTSLVLIMLVCLVFIYVMKWIAGPCVWLSILGVLALLSFGLYISINQYQYWKATPTVPEHSLNLSAATKNIFQNPTTWLVISIVVAVMLTVILLAVIILWSRISIAIALVKEGSKAVSCVTASVFFPVFPWVLYILTLVLAVGIGLYLASIGDSSFKMIQPKPTDEVCRCEGPAAEYTLGTKCDPMVFVDHCFVSHPSATLMDFFKTKVPCIETGCYFDSIESPNIVSYFQAYNVVGFLWLTFFVTALGEMVLAATFASWYWTYDKSDVAYFLLTKAFFQTVSYHLGTLALGAFILTICRLVRLVLEYIDRKLKKFDNSVTRCILCCMRCFFWCLENFLRYINKNAYIMCAIHGTNFCESAKNAFNLLMRNILRVVAVGQVTEFLFFLSKLLLTGIAGFLTYLYFTTSASLHNVHYVSIPIIAVVILSYLITSVFFGVYSMAVDTLFLCFLEDSERNDGSRERPFFMSKELMRILNKGNKRPSA